MTCFGLAADHMVHTTVLTLRVLKKVVQLGMHAEESSPTAHASIKKNEINKNCFCRPVNMVLSL